MFSAIHFIDYINRSIATKVSFTHFGCQPTTHSIYVFDDRWAQTSDIYSTSSTLTPHR